MSRTISRKLILYDTIIEVQDIQELELGLSIFN